MSNLTLAPAALPVPVEAFAHLSEDDRAALRRAVATLERPSLAARLSSAAGAPIDMIGRALPAPVTAIVTRSTEGAVRTALRLALASLPDTGPARPGTAVEARGEAGGEAGAGAPPAGLGRFLRTSEARHKAMAAAAGAVGGAFGIATLAVELPLSTTLMLRSIAEIAREEGEDLSDPENALACMQVFALGGRGEGGQNYEGADAALGESRYFAVRAALAKTMAEAAKAAAHRSLMDSSAPALVRFASQIAARFGIVVSQKVMAQAVPILGAAGGAAINAAFMDHFQATARAHFTVRRLERRYGRPAVRAAYAEEKAALGTA